MLKATVTNNGVKPINKWPTVGMDTATMNAMLNILVAEADKVQQVANELESTKNFLWLVFTKRAKAYGLILEPRLCVFVVCTLLENPAQSTQLLHALYHFQRERNALESELTFEVFNMQIFPMGYPSMTSWQQAWEAQKDKEHQNLLDSEHFYTPWVQPLV